MVTRYSKQREALIEILKSTDTHPTADWLYSQLRKQFPNVSLATVYRNLRQLSEQGEILALLSNSEPEHYDGCTKDHYHFMCSKCGAVKDLEIEVLSDLNSEVSKKTGFEISRHSLMFYGICRDCLQKK